MNLLSLVALVLEQGTASGSGLSPGSLTSSDEARLLPPGLDNWHFLYFRVDCWIV